MLVKGTCQKQQLLSIIKDAIISSGSNWQEVSSNKTQDYSWNVNTMADGYVFKSPPIGSKGQSVFMQLKSGDISITNTDGNPGRGGNHFYIWLADNYTPSSTANTNGIFTNRGNWESWCFTPIDTVQCTPTTLYNYYVDILDYRILIIIERNSQTNTTWPCFLYVGYPDPSTNIEGPNYTNQFIIGNNIMNPNGNTTIGRVYWHKGSNGYYNQWAVTNCPLNSYNPNPLGLYLLTPVSVTGDGASGLSNTGPLGVLTGLYGMPSTEVVNGDTLTIGPDTYKIFWLWNLNQYIAYGGIQTQYYENGITPNVIAFKIS